MAKPFSDEAVLATLRAFYRLGKGDYRFGPADYDGMRAALQAAADAQAKEAQ
jgi:hypothetical protein